MFLKQIFASTEKQSFEDKNASFKNIKFPTGKHQTVGFDINVLLSLLIVCNGSANEIAEFALV